MNPCEFRARLSERLKEQRPEFIQVLAEFIPCVKGGVIKALSCFDDKWIIYEVKENETRPMDVTMSDIKTFCRDAIPETGKDCSRIAVEFANKYYDDICIEVLDDIMVDDENENDC